LSALLEEKTNDLANSILEDILSKSFYGRELI